ncbi:hypothetical protein Ancab_028571 [Ancistrocladus abbreviatus]
MSRSQEVMELKPEVKNIGILKVAKSFLKNDSILLEKYVTRIRKRTTTLFETDSLLHISIRPSGSLSHRSGMLLSQGTSQNFYAPVFGNVSVFKRSYDLIERILKVYVYKEGEKPIFHQPKLRGLYASEGCSEMPRTMLYEEKSLSMKKLEKYIHYVNLIKNPYRFWNRTDGADHFFVACHDRMCFQCFAQIYSHTFLIAIIGCHSSARPTGYINL